MWPRQKTTLLASVAVMATSSGAVKATAPPHPSHHVAIWPTDANGRTSILPMARRDPAQLRPQLRKSQCAAKEPGCGELIAMVGDGPFLRAARPLQPNSQYTLVVGTEPWLQVLTTDDGIPRPVSPLWAGLEAATATVESVGTIERDPKHPGRRADGTPSKMVQIKANIRGWLANGPKLQSGYAYLYDRRPDLKRPEQGLLDIIPTTQQSIELFMGGAGAPMQPRAIDGKPLKAWWIAYGNASGDFGGEPQMVPVPAAK